MAFLGKFLSSGRFLQASVGKSWERPETGRLNGANWPSDSGDMRGPKQVFSSIFNRIYRKVATFGGHYRYLPTLPSTCPMRQSIALGKTRSCRLESSPHSCCTLRNGLAKVSNLQSCRSSVARNAPYNSSAEAFFASVICQIIGHCHPWVSFTPS